jgi:hypothetical protein
MVFKTGGSTCQRRPPRPLDLTLAWLEGASDAIFVPLKTEGDDQGRRRDNRPGRFGPEEADALAVFADAASL